jgi:TRAP-type mannitol/chloroaromatic compound transport system substrate-binding protein
MRGLTLITVLAIGLAAGYYGRTLRPADAPQAPSGGEVATSAPAADSGLGDPVRWKMASSFAATMPILGPSIEAFIDNVDTTSGGNMKIKFFDPGALVPPLEVFDAVASGSVDMGYSTPGFWAGKEAALQLFSAVPFGPASAEYMAWFYFGGGKAEFEAIYAKHNIKGHLCGLFAPEASGWFREEITSAEDLKGLKMRFFGLGARAMEKLGVSTQLIAPGDIFPALELGTIDATELASPAIDRNLGFYQIAKHYYFPGWHQQSTWVELIINMDRWNSLSDRQKRLFEVSCGDMVRRTIAQGESEQVPALEFLVGEGVTLHEWSPEMLGLFESAWTEVAAEEAAKDATFASAWKSLSEFRDRYATWRTLGYLK